MQSLELSYHGYRFPPEIISHAVWLYHRFCLTFRDVEDLLAQRGITVSYETIRQWCQTFGPDYAWRLRHRRRRLGDTWYLDELFLTIQGRRQNLWRAVDQDGDVLDILVQARRNRPAAARFFRKLLKGQGCAPRRLVTDKLLSYRAAHRTVMPCRPSSIARRNTRTTAPRFRINRRGSANIRCADSSRSGTRNGSCRRTRSYRTSFASAGTCCGRATIACYGCGRSSYGMRRPLPARP